MINELPIIGVLTRTQIWRRARHKISLHVAKRENSTFTGFLRLPTQFDALAGPVLNHVKAGGTKKIVLHVYGCSNGAEAYTVASVLKRKGIDFEVSGFDINEEMVTKARNGVYSTDEIFNNKIITDEFVQYTFLKEGGFYRIRPEIKEHVSFKVGDVLNLHADGPCGRCDILFAQNFLFHMKRPVAKRALFNLFGVLKPRAAIFLDGTDLDIRTKLTKREGLKPLDYEIEKIHNEARRARAIGWPYSYWGLEPFTNSMSNWKRRYSTIFLKGA